ncbi:UMTA methyltransferase family protein [Rutstroemia sp. NJR-2017a BBW]|nr:UMTA methyltransferase family protein [Rutstroemia sp. NJR-2017a BBW]
MQDIQSPDFNLANGRGYLLQQDYAAAGRLNLQLFLWKTTFGFNIHPSIHLQSNASIADIATGTALWAVEVAREIPAATVFGLDIDLSKAPHEEWLPSNLSLRKWNLFEEVPEDLLGKFDLIHVRLLVLVIENSDPTPLLRNIMKLLKPGGHFQWEELNYIEAEVKTVNASADISALDRFKDMIVSRGRNDWTVKLADFATKEGFGDANMYYFDDKLELIPAHMENYLMVMSEFASRVEANGLKQEGAVMRDIMEKAYQGGGAVHMPKVVCVAQKPQDLEKTKANNVVSD